MNARTRNRPGAALEDNGRSPTAQTSDVDASIVAHDEVPLRSEGASDAA